jgi:GDP-mannose 4,6 dehydratase
VTDKRAPTTGITGQDGSYLAEFLLEKGYTVFGMVRRPSSDNFERIEHLRSRLNIRQTDLVDQLSLIRLLEECRPHEVYNLAAQSFVPTAWQQPVVTGEFTALGVTRMLDAVRFGRPDDPLLPSVVQRDVREGPQDAPGRADAVPPPSCRLPSSYCRVSRGWSQRRLAPEPR